MAAPTAWTCPACGRAFTRRSQRHACGTGDLDAVLRGRPPWLVALWRALEARVRALGPVELVARDRYVLLRTRRIFADVVVRPEALRVAVHLGREARDPLFSKVVADRRHVSHVAQIASEEELERLAPYLAEARAWSLDPGVPPGTSRRKKA